MCLSQTSLSYHNVLQMDIEDHFDDDQQSDLLRDKMYSRTLNGVKGFRDLVCSEERELVLSYTIGVHH